MTVSTSKRQQTESAAWSALFAAWMLALTASLGALFIGEVMGQAPCVLCWFQRAFMFPLAIILATAAFKSDRNVISYAVPLAAGGWAMALYHALVYFKAIPEAIKPCGTGPSCSDLSMTLFGIIPIPLLSLGAFTAIIILLVSIYRRSKP